MRSAMLGLQRPVRLENAISVPQGLQKRMGNVMSWKGGGAIEPRRARKSLCISAVATAQSPEAPAKRPTIDMQERMNFLKEDLSHLFDDQGIDQTQYDDVVEFRDPITAYNNAKGYMFNISMLKRVFSPTFQLHDIKQTGDYEITTRWTMTMQFNPTRGTPLRNVWDPKLVFTGVSIMGVNPENGKFNRHIDYWDAIDNQEFFSLEAFGHVLSQMSDSSVAPDLPTPGYTILKKFKDFEVRRYDNMLVAETDLFPATSTSGRVQEFVNPADGGGSAFNSLAGFIFGGNSARSQMKMTTPVFTDTKGNMQFPMEPQYKDTESLPAPKTGDVRVKEVSGGLYAVAAFSGIATPDSSRRAETNLRQAMIRKAVPAAGQDWLLARYNDPFTLPMFRRNEVLIPVEKFELW